MCETAPTEMLRSVMGRLVQMKSLSSWMAPLLVAAIGVGCATLEKPAAPPLVNARTKAPEPVDYTWESHEYQKRGVPDPLRRWTADDYRACRDLLMGLSVSNRWALPQMQSAKSGTVFQRLVNSTNLLLLDETALPQNVRIRDFFGILNRMPVFIDLYRYDTREPVFHREFIELSHGFLRMLGSAVTWDGKKLPPSAGEQEGVTFQLSEYSRTYVDNLLHSSPNASRVPRGDRFIVVGSYAATTFRAFLPWLVDGSGQPAGEQLRAVAYLKNDMPVLWRHISVSLREESLDDIQELSRRTSNETLRNELTDLRRVLMAASNSN